MQYIENAEKNAFKLIFSRDGTNPVFLQKSGKICVKNSIIRLDYTHNTDIIGWVEPSKVIIRTLHRNLLPLYVRTMKNEIWLSNDVSELVISGETLHIRLVELLLAASGSSAIRSVFSHLIEDITILMPTSFYVFNFENPSPSIEWSDIDFDFHEKITKESFLKLLIEQYQAVYQDTDEICLAISGGFDSRLELAILTYLNKKIHCYHYFTSKRESAVAKKIASVAGASFHEVPLTHLRTVGYNFLKDKGYLTRWDGYFAVGALYSAGLLTHIYPGLSMRIMSTLTGWKGRLYQISDITEYWLQLEGKKISVALKRYPQYNSILNQEKEHRKKSIIKILQKIKSKNYRKDILADLSYNILSNHGKDAARSTFLFENGMPVFDGQKNSRELFISLLQEHKEENAFVEWAINEFNPQLMKDKPITSSMIKTERRFGIYGRIPLIKELFDKITLYLNAHNQKLMMETNITEIFDLIPEIKYISKHLKGDKPNLYITQICIFLKALRDKKNVSFLVVK